MAIVPSHPWHVSLGTDQRILNLVLPLQNSDLELHYVDPFENAPLAENDKLHIHRLGKKGTSTFRIHNSIYRTTRWIFNNPFWARRTLYWYHFLEQAAISYSKRLYETLREIDADIVFAEHDMAGIACIKLRKSLDTPVIVDLPGVWSEEMIASGVIRQGSRQAKNLKEFEGRIFKNADMLTVVSDEMKTFLVNRYDLSEDHVVVLLPSSVPQVKEAKRVEKPSKIVFSGMATYRERLDLIIRAMPIIQREYPSSELYLTKKGDILNEVRKLANELSVHPNYFYIPSPDDFYRFLSGCHIGVLTSSTDITRLMSYPAKLYDYFSVGLPVVANDIGGWTKIIKEKGAGILTESDPKSLAQGILRLLDNPSMIYELGQRGLDLLRTELNPDRPAKILYDTCKKLIN
jgi:glycosyltransferase involved in cell wall biosynthesis